MGELAATLDGTDDHSLLATLLRASVLRLLHDSLGSAAGSDPSDISEASAGLQLVYDAMHAGTPDAALRQLDRIWRCAPDAAAVVAPIYGRILLLESQDVGAALQLLRRGMAFTAEPESAALIAWALMEANQEEDARAELVSALTAFMVEPGDLLFQIAGSITQRLGDTPGWFGRGADLGLVGEIAFQEHGQSIDVEFAGHAVANHRLPSPRSQRRRAFSVACSSTEAGESVAVSVRGARLLGSGARLPSNFALDGRVENRERCLQGWASLGWAPTQALRIAIEDENGCRAITETHRKAEGNARSPFELDLEAVQMHGNRLQITAQLPDGRWQSLPDSPLLMDPRLSVAPGKPLRLVPWGREPVRPRKRMAAVEPARSVDIIIPVYRGREVTLACIDAVLASVDAATPVIVVDDATDDTALAEALDALAAHGRITLLRHANNQGFVVSVNRGMAQNPTHDAVLLNSDTCVYGDWLARLRAAAYSGDAVGTVTPLSNSGSIASYPRASGSVIDPTQGAALHALAAAVHSDLRVPIPVGVGFCLYVRRDCLDDVGPLDAAVFDKGYGEETDFCLRARRRGWSHRLAADVFVYHAGGLSFGGRRTALLERSQRLLNLRHPGFDRFVASFQAQDPLRTVRRQLDERRLLGFNGRFVLLVTLALSGGVARFVAERCRVLRAQGLYPLLLKPAAAGDRSRCVLSTEALDAPNLQYDIPTELESLGDLLRALNLAAVEIQHFLHLDARVIEAVRALPLPYDVVVHDYAWICPRITLIDGSGRYCGEPAVALCERCVHSDGSNLGETLSVAALRARSDTWLRGAGRVIAPTADTAARLQRHFKDLAVTVQPNSPPAAEAPPRQPSSRKMTRIALIGAIGEHKGYQVLLDCARQARARQLAIEFVVIGYTENDAALLETGKVFITGRYGEAEVPHLLQRENPDVVWLPSVWPETWCYALDHALSAGPPVVAFDIGAMAERLRAAGRGELLPLSLDAAGINERLLQLANEARVSGATLSRSEQTALAHSRKVATMDLTNTGEHIMTNPSDSKPLEQTPGDALSASVQVLPLDAGLYLFSVTTAIATPGAVGASLRLPALHVGMGPGVPAERVEFMSGPATQGAWLFAATDQLVVKVHAPGATLILTSVRAPVGDVLSIKVERLSSRVETAAAIPATVEPVTTPDPLDSSLRVRIAAHIRSRGDTEFSAVPWAGRIAPGLWIESFSVRPLETFSAQDLEYKGLTGSGFETPWLTDDQPCGTQGMSVPLVGFALRFKPSAATAAYDCEYSGYFQSGVTVGPLRNGAPCRSTVANDPLEGIQVRLVKRGHDKIAGARRSAAEFSARADSPARAAVVPPAPRRNERPAPRLATRSP